MIEVIGLHKKFGGRPVLDGMDLQIPTGQSVVIIGQSGCGKSVLLKHLVALLRPDGGEVRVEGKNIFNLSQGELMTYRRRVGVLFQSGALFDSMTVAENVGFSLLECERLKASEINSIVEDKLRLVALSGIGEQMPSEISGGMKKRVALARAIATDPDILLYDEPTTGLDPITADMINELIVAVNEQLGVTSIAVTHDLTSARKIAHRIVMLHEGRVIWDGTPDEIDKTDNAVVRQFVAGSSVGPIKVH